MQQPTLLQIHEESTPMRNNSIRMQGWPLPICWELGCSQEPTKYYFLKELCSDQNLTSDFTGLLKDPLMKAALYQVPNFILQYTFTFSPATVLQIISHYYTVLISTSQSIHSCFLPPLFTPSFNFIDTKNP